MTLLGLAFPLLEKRSLSLLTLVAVFFILPAALNAQSPPDWQVSGNNISFLPGSVGVGIDDFQPNSKGLLVKDGLQIWTENDYQSGVNILVGYNSDDTGVHGNDFGFWQAFDWDNPGQPLPLALSSAVMIGTTTFDFDHQLVVDGSIKTREIVVTNLNWPDYVFEGGYHLPSLSRLESLIQSEGHLPGIPSAREIAEEGIQVGQMQGMLLEKIEELSLYLIDLDKQNKNLRARLIALEESQ
ncbi:MAG: hypothetical protein K0U98_24995 [Deltaproteobacteria bacterium]|nr:hypothetical protein [Deltaproteobacteria bacterium]